MYTLYAPDRVFFFLLRLFVVCSLCSNDNKLSSLLLYRMQYAKYKMHQTEMDREKGRERKKEREIENKRKKRIMWHEYWAIVI